MKKVNIIYWIFTILFAGLMLYTALPDVTVSKQSVDFTHGLLGYPKYFIPFIGTAKVLGIIAILIPLPPRLKEWAYAGLFFDITAAAYSSLCVMASPWIVMMLIWIVPGIISYIYYHKRLKLKTQQA